MQYLAKEAPDVVKRVRVKKGKKKNRRTSAEEQLPRRCGDPRNWKWRSVGWNHDAASEKTAPTKFSACKKAVTVHDDPAVGGTKVWGHATRAFVSN